MSAVWKWLVDNRTWVFDGFGVAIAAGLIGILWKRRKRDGAAQSIRVGDRSVNVQAGRDVALQVGDREDAGAVAVREWVDLAKENDQRARGLEEKLARAHMSGDKLMATSYTLGAGSTPRVASNKELAKLMQDNFKLADDMRAYNAELADRFDAA